MRGVRGFADPRAVKLPSGKSVWHQPWESGHLLPFRPDVEDLGQTFLPDPPHGWADTHAAWNAGQYDRWVPNKGVTTMTYHTRRDLPYQFALADAFTICDNYHCSLMGPTDPNRYHMWTGWVGNDGSRQDRSSPTPKRATTGPPTPSAAAAGISWKVYQDVGVSLDAAGFWAGPRTPTSALRRQLAPVLPSVSVRAGRNAAGGAGQDRHQHPRAQPRAGRTDGHFRTM
jgi:phospholipase C